MEEKTVSSGGPERYQKAFDLHKNWVENSMDLYKASWPSWSSHADLVLTSSL